MTKRIVQEDRGYRIAYRWADGYVQRAWFASVADVVEHLLWLRSHAYLFTTDHAVVKYIRSPNGRFCGDIVAF